MVWDRADDVPADLAAEDFDAVVDVSRTPSHVRKAVAAWPDAHWVFVSTINVYADNATPDPGPDSARVDPIDEDHDLKEHPESYGPMKVSCENAVQAGAPRSTLVRPGLIVGPGDPTGRYGYWPERLADAGPVLGPGDPADRVQIIDVRDLAEWIVRLAERRHDRGVRRHRPGQPDRPGARPDRGGHRGRPRDRAGRARSSSPSRASNHWAGDGALPLWLPRPEYDGMITHRFDVSEAAGLTVRSYADTARDTLAWIRATPDAARTGMSREREAEVLTAREAR